MNNVFNSKIILFGEYAILKGGKLLAIPYNYFNGTLKIVAKRNTIQEISHNTISKLFLYIAKQQYHNPPNLKQLKSDIDAGLYFDSNIPQGYGIGSSGALVAAIYNAYFFNRKALTPDSNWSTIQNDLAKIESFFHGNSSGADPLVSYTNKAQLLNEQPVNSIPDPMNLVPFLIDTKIVGKTDQFVTQFNEHKNTILINAFIEANNAAIEGLLKQNNTLFNQIKILAKIECELLTDMFVMPKRIEQLRNEYSNTLTIKLCGSGGGGFLLGFAKKHSVKAILQSFKSMNIPTYPLYNMDKR